MFSSNSATNTNTTADQQIAQLKKQIADGVENTKSYLTSLQGKVSDYDKEHNLSDKASSYLQAGIDKANWSVNELKDFGARFQNESKEISDEVISTGKSTLASVRSSLEDIKSKAIAYDEKAKETASNEASNAKSSLADLVESAREHGNSFFDSISSSFENLQKQISANATAASNTASDAYQSTKNTASNAAQSAKNTVSDATTTTTNKISETDQNVTGGVGADLYNKTAELVNQGVEYVSSAFQSSPADKAKSAVPEKP